MYPTATFNFKSKGVPQPLKYSTIVLSARRRYQRRIRPSKLLSRFTSRVRDQLGVPPRWVHHSLAGHDVVVRDGGFDENPGVVDYDDAWIFACAKHAKVVFDVGSNVGQSAMLMLLCSNVEEIVLVEANERALATAAENLIRNRLSARARFVAAFASDASNATVDLWTVGTGAAGSIYRGHAVSAASAGTVQQVRTTTLDELCERYRIVPDLVKIDVEGAESNVLAGSLHLVAHHRTRFLVEVHALPELSMAQNATSILEWAENVGYTAWYLASGVRLESVEPVLHRGRCHFLLQPKKWAYPDWLVGIAQSSKPV